MDGPHNIPLVALGTGLLWFGWYGFNAGSELQVDTITVLAFLNTDVAASFAAITRLILAWVIEKKPKFVGLLTGAVAGTCHNHSGSRIYYYRQRGYHRNSRRCGLLLRS
ncbi:MAG: hypothetical protein ACOCX7_02775 [Bacteroidota bacterium]